MQDNTQNVPQWFTAFVKQNADEHGRLATEIATTRGDLREEIATLRGDLGATSAGLREEMATLRTEIAKAEARSTRWMVGTILGAATITITFLTVAMTIIVG